MSQFLFLALFFIFFFFFFHPTTSTSTDSFIYGGCSQLKYPPGSPYESNINSLLTSIVNSATFSNYNKYTITGSSPQDVVYGLYQCRGDLSIPDCARCTAQAVSQLGVLCLDSCGGAIELDGCFVKYDNNTFLGIQDKNVVMKKCGPSIGFDNDLMGRRDMLLSGLGSGGGGYYRVGGSGKVQGMAQCVSDLSTSECQDCLSEAIGRLKSDCGTAVSGDMYLGKCYARYSASGVDSKAQSGSSSSSSSDDAQKALAITIGLLAGVALIIVFLSFLRKIFGVKGGK